MPENKRKKGNLYEEKAAAFLAKCGFKILYKNFFCKMGEVDIIALEGDILCFIEVKYRKRKDSGSPFEAVDFRKQRHISAAFDYFIMTHEKYQRNQIRFDVVGILDDEITLIRNAFSYAGRM